MRKLVNILGMIATAVMFAAIMFMLAAAPGFLTNRDSTVPVPSTQADAR